MNGAARPSEHCSKESSHSPMPSLSSRLPAPHSSLTRSSSIARCVFYSSGCNVSANRLLRRFAESGAKVIVILRPVNFESPRWTTGEAIFPG
jgi:hypothetical protein